MPPGGDGYYYFSVYYVVTNDEYGRFNIVMNRDLLCSAYTEEEETPGDPGQATCSAAIYASAGMNNLQLCILYFEYMGGILLCQPPKNNYLVFLLDYCFAVDRGYSAGCVQFWTGYNSIV